MGRTIAEAAANLEQVAKANIIGPRYIAGIKKADWQTAAASEQAELNYASGVQAAITDKRRQAGVMAVSNQDWQTAAEMKGGPIISNRVLGGIAKYTRNFGPILEQVNRTVATLPARTTSPSQNIRARMEPVVQAMVEASGKTYT